jgi:hypothetical protein
MPVSSKQGHNLEREIKSALVPLLFINIWLFGMEVEGRKPGSLSGQVESGSRMVTRATKRIIANRAIITNGDQTPGCGLNPPSDCSQLQPECSLSNANERLQSQNYGDNSKSQTHDEHRETHMRGDRSPTLSPYASQNVEDLVASNSNLHSSDITTPCYSSICLRDNIFTDDRRRRLR